MPGGHAAHNVVQLVEEEEINPEERVVFHVRAQGDNV